MAAVEKTLSGSISLTAVSASLSASDRLSADLNSAKNVVEKDYEKLLNRPKINGVELVSDKSFEDLGFSELSALDVFNILDNIWKG